jgi:hypothetical protein
MVAHTLAAVKEVIVMPIRETLWQEELLQQIVGEELSSVEFVHDYVQLRFNGPTLTAVTQPVVQVGEHEYRWCDPGFRDELCKRIASRLIIARIQAGDTLRLEFEDRAIVKVSLRDEDYRAAEAVRFDLNPSKWWTL